MPIVEDPPNRANLELSLWARNLNDCRYLVRAVTGPVVTAIPGDRRTFGVTLTYRLGE
jgi:outer membrane receptor protein involved in Fe transport